MTQPTHYDPDLGLFLRTYNIAYEFDGGVFEAQIKAKNWDTAEAMLAAIKASGVVYSELVEVYPA